MKYLRFKWINDKRLWYVVVLAILILGVQGSTSKSLLDLETPKDIDLSVLPGLQYSIPRFHVLPGQKVNINFTNTDDMDHNLLIIKPNTREKVVDLVTKLGAAGQLKKYIPDTDAILFHTSVLSEGQTETLSFKAPLKEGIYTYVCTLPGHGHVMYGAIYVNYTGEMPPLKEDDFISQTFRRSLQNSSKRKDHPYELKPPYYYRLYIEGASPAAIVAHLPGDLSYCWDATPCQLRFMWKDGFVDNTELWKGHKDAKAQIEGEFFYREDVSSILEIGLGSSIKKSIKFKGYRLIDSGYLEFHYSINDLDVFEQIREIKEGRGILRQFTIPKLQDQLIFNFTNQPGVSVYYKGSPISEEYLLLDRKEGKQFTIEFRLD